MDLWKYSYTVHKDSNGTVFLIFAGDDSKENACHGLRPEMKDGIVRRTWRVVNGGADILVCYRICEWGSGHNVTTREASMADKNVCPTRLRQPCKE